MSLTDRWERATLTVARGRERERTGADPSREVFAGPPAPEGVIEEIGRTR